MWGPMKNIPVLFPPTEPPKNKIFVFLFLNGCVYYQPFAFAFFSMYVCVFEKLCFTMKTRALKNLLSLPIIEELKYRTNIFWKFPQRQSLFLKVESQYFMILQLTANKIITCYMINIKMLESSKIYKVILIFPGLLQRKDCNRCQTWKVRFPELWFPWFIVDHPT